MGCVSVCGVGVLWLNASHRGQLCYNRWVPDPSIEKQTSPEVGVGIGKFSPDCGVYTVINSGLLFSRGRPYQQLLSCCFPLPLNAKSFHSRDQRKAPERSDVVVSFADGTGLFMPRDSGCRSAPSGTLPTGRGVIALLPESPFRNKCRRDRRPGVVIALRGT